MLSNWKDICVSENPEQLPVYITRDINGNVSDHIVMAKKRDTTEQPEQSPRRRQNQASVKKNKFPYFFVEKNHQKKSFQSKFKNKIQKAISETKHTVLTDKNRRVHKNQISNPITVQDTEKQTLKFQSSRRKSNAATSVSPKRRPTPNNETGTPSKWIQKRDEYGQFIGDWVEAEENKTQTSTPERAPTVNEMMSPGLFLNTTEEGEINQTAESEPGNIKQETNINEETNTVITEEDQESPVKTRSVRNRTRPKYYGSIRYT